MEGPDALLVPLSPALLHLRHRPNIYTTPTADHSGVSAVYRMYSRVYAVPVGQSPTRPGGGGATPTLKTRDTYYSIPEVRHILSVQLQPYCKHTMYPILHRSATKPIQSKRNEKENHDKQKTESLKPTRDSLELYFLFMGLQPLKPCFAGLTTNE